MCNRLASGEMELRVLSPFFHTFKKFVEGYAGARLLLDGVLERAGFGDIFERLPIRPAHVDLPQVSTPLCIIVAKTNPSTTFYISAAHARLQPRSDQNSMVTVHVTALCVSGLPFNFWNCSTLPAKGATT